MNNNIYYPYTDTLLYSSPEHRDNTSSADYLNLAKFKPNGPLQTNIGTTLDSFFMDSTNSKTQSPYLFSTNYTNTDLNNAPTPDINGFQTRNPGLTQGINQDRLIQNSTGNNPMSPPGQMLAPGQMSAPGQPGGGNNKLEENGYIKLASNSLHVAPDQTMNIFFSDSNIKFIQNAIVSKIRDLTAKQYSTEGITLQPANMNDLFYYMVNAYQNYKVYNGSICFVNLKKGTDIKSEITKLNSDILQEYTSKLMSQINMYVYYYKDASQLPTQLTVPEYTSMKGSRVLEYNNAFTPGKSREIASYNESNNIL